MAVRLSPSSPNQAYVEIRDRRYRLDLREDNAIALYRESDKETFFSVPSSVCLWESRAVGLQGLHPDIVEKMKELWKGVGQ